MSKSFHIGEILSVTTGIMVSPTRMDGVYAIANYMTGDDIYTHQLPRVCRNELAPALERQLPFLKKIKRPEVTPDTWEAWLKDIVYQYGAQHSIVPLSEGEHERKNPIDEIVEMKRGDNG